MVVEWVPFTNGNAAAHETIVEFVQTLELQAMDEIGRRVAEIELQADRMLFGIEDRIGIDGRKGR